MQALTLHTVGTPALWLGFFAVVLAFVGAKMLFSGAVHVPIAASLGIVALLLGGSVATSLVWPVK